MSPVSLKGLAAAASPLLGFEMFGATLGEVASFVGLIAGVIVGGVYLNSARRDQIVTATYREAAKDAKDDREMLRDQYEHERDEAKKAREETSRERLAKDRAMHELAQVKVERSEYEVKYRDEKHLREGLEKVFVEMRARLEALELEVETLRAASGIIERRQDARGVTQDARKDTQDRREERQDDRQVRQDARDPDTP